MWSEPGLSLSVRMMFRLEVTDPWYVAPSVMVLSDMETSLLNS